MDVFKLREAQLSRYLEPLLAQIGLKLVQEQVAIGSFRLDAVAEDANGDLVVIELKTCKSIATLGQLLLYPHALRKALCTLGVAPIPKIKTRLITTYLDKNVEELAVILSAYGEIEISICTVDEVGSLTLKSPNLAPQHVGDQASLQSGFKSQEIWKHIQGQQK